MGLYRMPTALEEKLLKKLVDKSTIVFSEDCLEGLLVAPMEDDGMGSHYLFPKNK